MDEINKVLNDPATRTELRRWILDAQHFNDPDPLSVVREARKLVWACEMMAVERIRCTKLRAVPS